MRRCRPATPSPSAVFYSDPKHPKPGNSAFVDKAPAEVVEKEWAKVEDVKAALGSLREQRGKIEGL